MDQLIHDGKWLEASSLAQGCGEPLNEVDSSIDGLNLAKTALLQRCDTVQARITQYKALIQSAAAEEQIHHTQAAIEKYQEAYKIVSDPAIIDKIKDLHNNSLGL